MLLIDQLSEIYRPLLTDNLSIDVHDESFAVCNNCSMCSEQSPHSSNTFYSPNTKCCTFHPHLPNYLVGFILNSADITMIDGQTRIKEILRNRIGVFPSGIYPSKKYQSLYFHYNSTVFGKSESLLCPFYIRDSGLCGIWKAREAVCSTYFCVHTAGNKGRELWMAVKSYLSHIQECLILYCNLELNFTRGLEDGLLKDDKITIEDFDELPIDDKEYYPVWKEYIGREEDYYKKCYSIVRSLDNSKLSEILGIKGEFLLNDILKRNFDLDELPQKLIRNPKINALKSEDNIWRVPLGKTRVGLSIPNELVMLFDGDLTLTEIIQKANCVGIDSKSFTEKVYVLYQHKFLIEPEP